MEIIVKKQFVKEFRGYVNGYVQDVLTNSSYSNCMVPVYVHGIDMNLQTTLLHMHFQ